MRYTFREGGVFSLPVIRSIETGHMILLYRDVCDCKRHYYDPQVSEVLEDRKISE